MRFWSFFLTDRKKCFSFLSGSGGFTPPPLSGQNNNAFFSISILVFLLLWEKINFLMLIHQISQIQLLANIISIMSVCLFDCLPGCLSVYIFDHICYTYLPVCLCELIVFTYFVVCVSHRQKLSIMIESFTYTSLCISLSFSMCLCLSVAIRGGVGYFYICVKTTRSSFFLFFSLFLFFLPF